MDYHSVAKYKQVCFQFGSNFRIDTYEQTHREEGIKPKLRTS